jgi:hypothetical protein
MDSKTGNIKSRIPLYQPFVKNLKCVNFPYLILLSAATVRIIGYASSSIRYDEALSLYRATIPIFQYLTNLQNYSSLVLWEVSLRVIRLIGSSLWIIRLPSVLYGIFCLIVVWNIVKRLAFTNLQSSFVLVIIGFCPGLIWISQDARAYGLLVLIYLLSISFLLERKWFGFVTANGLLLYTHIISPAFVFGSFIYGIILFPKEWKRFLFLALLVIICWLPWGLLNILQAVNQQNSTHFITTFWLGKLTVGGFFWQLILAYFVRIINYPTITIFLTIIVLSIVILVINSIRNPNKNLFIFLTPFCVILFESIFWKNTLFFRTIITLIIPFVLSLGSVLAVEKRKLFDTIIVGLWFLITGFGILGWNPRLRGGDIDITANVIRNNWQAGDVIYYATGTTALPFDYYLSDKTEYILDGIANANLTPPTLDKFEFIPLEKIQYKRAWVIFPEDIFIPTIQMIRLQNYTKDGELINRIKIFEIPDILVYLVNR